MKMKVYGYWIIKWFVSTSEIGIMLRIVDYVHVIIIHQWCKNEWITWNIYGVFIFFLNICFSLKNVFHILWYFFKCVYEDLFFTTLFYTLFKLHVFRPNFFIIFWGGAAKLFNGIVTSPWKWSWLNVEENKIAICYLQDHWLLAMIHAILHFLRCYFLYVLSSMHYMISFKSQSSFKLRTSP